MKEPNDEEKVKAQYPEAVCAEYVPIYRHLPMCYQVLFSPWGKPITARLTKSKKQAWSWAARKLEERSKP